MLRKLLLPTLFLFIFSGVNYSQSVEQGANIIGLSVRLGLFNTTVVDKTNNNASNSGRAGYAQYLVSLDHGINDRFTVGSQFRYNEFIIGKDTTKNQSQINVASGFDLCAYGAFHFVRSEHVDLYTGIALGYSYLKLANTNLNSQAVYKANGLAYNIDIGARFYLGNHFGIALTLGYAGYYYPNGTATVSGGATDNFSISFSGSTYGLGLCYKFN
jgi:hypothetical protein